MLSKALGDSLFVQLGQIVIIFKEVLDREPKVIAPTNFQLLSRQSFLFVVL